MKQHIFAFVLLYTFSACSEVRESSTDLDTGTTATKEIHLKKQWETQPVFKIPESVIYDSKRDRLYVSNINGDEDKDGDGFISILSLNGEVDSLKWITGLSNPKGMGIIDDTLYVTDASEVAKIDINSGRLIKRFPVSEKNPGLNDITTSLSVVYISGNSANKIYQIKNDSLTVAFEDNFGGPNGLLFRRDSIFIATNKAHRFKVIGLEGKKVKTLTEKIESGDGIVELNDGSFITSSWDGALFHINTHWEKQKIMDTEDREINAADIWYIKDRNLLLVPTFHDNRVLAYEVVLGE